MSVLLIFFSRFRSREKNPNRLTKEEKRGATVALCHCMRGQVNGQRIERFVVLVAELPELNRDLLGRGGDEQVAVSRDRGVVGDLMARIGRLSGGRLDGLVRHAAGAHDNVDDLLTSNTPC